MLWLCVTGYVVFWLTQGKMELKKRKKNDRVLSSGSGCKKMVKTMKTSS